MLFSAITLYAVPLVGVAVEEGSDMPIPFVEVVYVSGKSLGQSDSRGRFEFDVDSRNAILIFARNGFDSLKVELQDYTDLLDVVVSLKSGVRNLGSATVVGGGVGEWQNPKEISMQKLEDAAGLRFDLAEHLSQISGMSGQKDFSGDLFYDGSRSEEVAYHLGLLRVPNMRHLDVGFPGNLSVINPHTISQVNINEHYGMQPFNQGVAGAVQFVPKNKADNFEANVSLGTTLREITLNSPFFVGDGFTVSARYLDPSMLKNMGEKFFTEFRKQGESCGDCQVSPSNSFSMSSMDIYANIFGSDSLYNSWAIAGLYASDDYSINQDLSTDLSKRDNIAIIQGSQIYSLASAEYRTGAGTNFFAGVVSQETADTLRDTSAFRKLDLSCQNKEPFCYFIDENRKEHLTVNAGVSWEQTENLGFALIYDFHNVSRKFPNVNAKLSDNVAQATGYYRLGDLSFGGGAIFASSRQEVRPLFSIDYDGGVGSAIFANAAWRTDWNAEFEGGKLKGKLNDGASLKAGARYSSRGMDVSAHGFGRYYPNPILPIPQAYEYYDERQSVDFGWVMGSGLTIDFHSLHRVAFQSNFSSVYGEYELPNGHSLPWVANSRLDMVSHLRIYPRADSLLSLILSHHIAWNRPLYNWHINEKIMKREIYYSGDNSSLFRTDIRFNLDLTSKVKIIFLNKIRFFVEADNIFSGLDVAALRFLGADNARERSLTVQDYDGDSRNGFNVVPFMAKGMGLYLQFGIEGNFGI
ncbi:hypothetical protein AGMMS49938_13430 [Fibrobacterales bacterium]|nr:hypothetical protein AGMMS49938_13430 [Fibrobacterales bacterium]